VTVQDEEVSCGLEFILEDSHFSKEKKPLNSVICAMTMYTDLGRLTTTIPFPQIKKPSSRIQSKVLTEGWRSCTTMLLMILWSHHLALLYNPGILGRHLKLPEVVESVCVNFCP